MVKARTADIINISFILLFSSLTILYHGSIQASNRLLALYLVLLFIHLYFLRISPEKGLLKFLHDIVLPVITVVLIFDNMTELISGINPVDIDFKLIRVDYWIFGVYPTVWLERFLNPFLVDLFQLGYSVYYFLPVVLGLILKIKNKDREFDNTLATILLCFYLSYLGYILFPALGPRYVMEHLHSIQIKGALFYEMINNFLNHLEGVKRDAFPSGHTAVTLVVLHLSYLYERMLFYILLPITLLLVISTVYCRYHYVIDVLGGIGLYVVTILIGRKILK
jgi:membrane-associated phospholipid phosphatase